MNLLLMILGAAGILFIIAMLLICIGIFHTPKEKPDLEEFDFPQYAPTGRSLDAAAVSAENDEICDDDQEQDEENSGDNDEGEAASDDEEAEDDESGADPDSAADNDGSSEDPDGINISVTIIETNKTFDVTVTDETLVGRNPRCDIVIAKPMVSSVHCILINDNGKLMAEDNNSTNGTLLNGKQLKHVVELKNNDVLTLGDKQIRINL